MAACPRSPASADQVGAPSGRPIQVFVSVLPQRYFAERLAGERAIVEVLVEPGRDPHSFDPSPRQIARLSAAAVFFTIGMPFEATLVSKVGQANPELRVVDTIAGIELLPLAGHYHEGDEAHEDDDEAGELDPHVWLGPQQVRCQLIAMRDGLIAADPAGEAVYRQNHERLDAEVAAMDRRFAVLLAPLGGKSILTFHPTFGYFTATYGINQLSIELDGKEPSPRRLEDLIGLARQEGVKVIFAQPEFPPRSAEIIAQAIGGSVVSLNALEADWPGFMERLATAVAAGAY
ncbi:MAG: hypothetical protein A2087_07470 [Spirochaetes bacterium GWD1_61_31]|nr:MAG: hypothetical protein A2Y37_08000 [Spirochaetes bacterium GWB1_60_80]OHD34250.1 MAG: hypothetical protein A2004_12750 [Spirochaetes bacterium GWC1_61_12]OHD40178.1 MAG: hypothetical protein A2087_07470 [Spirochaetes bacterium GWD1_61_31]OHD45774.1 MAG: hypothetical protein A2Y35_03635 [Spirochaetes bacterium GWE1_60_18]OHD58318.1 MAG: hypothetical protein A2Y32_06025 [Spirochaetes bacterium GWF1_60_12]